MSFLNKKHFLLQFLLLFFAISCTQEADIIKVETVTISQPTAEMVEGESVQLKAIITPENASDRKVIWSSSKLSVATVTDEGLVAAIAEGTATIFASVGDKRGSCEIIVSKRYVPVSSVSIIPDDLILTQGEEYQLGVEISPKDATDQSVIWESDDRNVAAVDGEGKLKAIREGTARIKAKVGTVEGFCTVTVDYLHVSRITLDKTSLVLQKGEGYMLIATVYPEDAARKDITWSSSDNAVATVDNGQVTAINKGRATITATADGISVSCEVEVVVPVSEIAFNKNELNLIIGESEKLILGFYPEDANQDGNIYWSSSDTDVASVDNTGVVLAKKEGMAVVTALFKGKEAKCNVSVDYIHVSSLTLNMNEATQYVGESLKLEATVAPQEATYKTVEWTSSDTEVATVSNTGTVTAIRKGTATITAKTDGLEARCVYTVLTPAEQITVTPSRVELFIGETTSFSVITSPADATLKGPVNWSSSATSKATISNEGLMMAVGGGYAVITAIADGLISSASVVIHTPVSGISLSQTSISINKGQSFPLSLSIQPVEARIKGGIVWSSSDNNVATVDENGVVTAINGGEAIISVSVDGFVASCIVKVVVPLQSISLSADYIKLNRGETATLTYTLNPPDATVRNVGWRSANPSIASVSSSGVVRAVSEGYVNISVSAGDLSASCVVEVKVPVSSIVLDQTSMRIVRGGVSSKLTATIYPTDATIKTVKWTSSNPDIATVNINGWVSGKTKGSAIIIAEADGVTAECPVEVYVPVKSVTCSEGYVQIVQGNKYQLQVVVEPSDASYDSIIWTSSDETVVTVDQNGLVTAKRAGGAYIYAEAVGIKGKCFFEVSTPGDNEDMDQEIWK